MPNDARLLLLDKHAVGALLLPEAVSRAVTEAFILHSQREGRVFAVVREPLNTGAIFGIKSGDVQNQQLLGFKAAGFWPRNREQQHEPHQATIMLMDPATGRPLCVIDGNAVTTLRTGAAGALGLSLLARTDSTTLCVFGTGVQARVQLSFVLKAMPQLEQIYYVSSDNRANEAFEQQFGAVCHLRHATDRNAAVAASDIVITATPGRQILFDPDAVQPGTHLNCVGADTAGKRELPDGLLTRARLFVDDRAQASTIGEMQWAPACAAIELGDLLTAQASFIRQAEDITVFDMTGLALQDLTVARMLCEQAIAQGLGTRLPWPW